jgi:hypothetical protein
MSLRELAAWALEHQPRPVQRAALATSFLTEQTYLETIGPLLGLSDRWLNEDSVLYRGYAPLRVELATAICERLFFVGLVEQMDASIRLLRRRLLAHGLTLAEAPVPVENVSWTPALDTSWLHRDDAVGSVVLDSLQDDLRFYNRMRTRFEVDLAGEAARPTARATLGWLNR